MQHLKKTRENNLKQYQKARQYLQQLGTDLDSLPSLPPHAASSPKRNPPIYQQAEEEEDDSLGFCFEQYLKEKQKRESAEALNRSNSASNVGGFKRKQDKSEPTFNIGDYEYNSNLRQQREEASWEKMPRRQDKVSKVNKKKAIEPKGRLITEEDRKKLKIENVFVKEEPLKPNYILADTQYWEGYRQSEDYRLEYVLRRFPYIKKFQNNQKAIIKCGREGNNIFVCMPTGGGKSLTFQFLTFLVKGVYICVLPLISLIFDQEYQAKLMGIQAYSLTANTKGKDLKLIFDKLMDFQFSENSIVIFCTPEKLNLSQQFGSVLEALYQRDHLRRFIIDEVHCVSTWGKDFRTQYKKLSELKRNFPKTPILALTATVTEIIKQDIIKQLGIQNCYYFQSSFNRPNLYYQVREKTKRVNDDISAIIDKYPNKTGIIYCLSKRECQEMSSYLERKGHRTAFYHADISEEEKKDIQERWMSNEISIIIATIAFGMGINKPDVRYVVHHTMSKSLQNYYQQSGRGGRDGLFSQCILFFRKSDKQFLQSLNFQNDFSTLERKQFSSKQLAQMIKYCEEKSMCRRQFQLKYLGEQFDPQNCHKTCDNCKRGAQYMEYECIEEGRALVRLVMLSDRCYISLSKTQLINLVKGKVQKSNKYKADKLESSGVSLEELKEMFRHWKPNQIETLLLDLISAEILTERVVKTQVNKKNNKGNEVHNLYLKSNAFRCKAFLEKVQSLPLKRYTYGSLQTSKEYQQEGSEQEYIGEQDTGYQQLDRSREEASEGSGSAVEDEEDRRRRFQKYRELLEDIFEDQFGQRE